MGVRHLGHDEAMEAGGLEVVRSIPDRDTIVGWVFCPTRQLELVWFFHLNVPFFQNSEFIWNVVLVGSSNCRPSAPFLYEVASHVKNCHFGDYYYNRWVLTLLRHSLRPPSPPCCSHHHAPCTIDQSLNTKYMTKMYVIRAKEKRSTTRRKSTSHLGRVIMGVHLVRWHSPWTSVLSCYCIFLFCSYYQIVWTCKSN